MGRKNNRTCLICNKSYSYCPTCGEDAGKPSWYLIFDGENCHDIYDVCVAYRDKIFDAKKAYEEISKLDISGLEDFNETTKAQIKEIISLNKENERKLESKESDKEFEEVPKKMIYPRNNKR